MLCSIFFLVDAALMSSSLQRIREKTRSTLPSTAHTRSLQAMEAIAPAVYGPLPGSSSSASLVCGSSPSWRSTQTCAHFFMFRTRL